MGRKRSERRPGATEPDRVVLLIPANAVGLLDQEAAASGITRNEFLRRAGLAQLAYSHNARNPKTRVILEERASNAAKVLLDSFRDAVEAERPANEFSEPRDDARSAAHLLAQEVDQLIEAIELGGTEFLRMLVSDLRKEVAPAPLDVSWVRPKDFL